jgi:hypothetical protein
MKKLEATMDKRLLPKNHNITDAITPLGKMLDIVARFEGTVN